MNDIHTQQPKTIIPNVHPSAFMNEETNRNQQWNQY